MISRPIHTDMDMNNENNEMSIPGSCQNRMNRSIRPGLRMCQLNVEGISKSKCHLLSKILKDNDFDLAVIQETQLTDEKDPTLEVGF